MTLKLDHKKVSLLFIVTLYLENMKSYLLDQGIDFFSSYLSIFGTLQFDNHLISLYQNLHLIMRQHLHVRTLLQGLNKLVFTARMRVMSLVIWATFRSLAMTLSEMCICWLRALKR